MASTSWYPQVPKLRQRPDPVKQEEKVDADEESAEQIEDSESSECQYQQPEPEPERKEEEEQPMKATSSSQRFCRLCLSKEQQLKPLFPPNGAPDEALLQRILNCLTIVLSFEKDYDSFICRICIQEVTKFFLYKEQCLANDSILHGRRKPDKVSFYAEDEADQPANNNGMIEIPDSDYDEDAGEPIDSDEFDIRDDGEQQGNVDEDDDGNDDDDDEDDDDFVSGDRFDHGGMTLARRMLKPLPRQRARRENVQDYYYGGFRYTCATSRANGKVHWRCMYKSKLKCRAAILVAPNGTITKGHHRHNHHPENKPVLPYPLQGTILDVHTGRKVNYKLVTSNRSRINRMQVVCDGYKYRYARATQKQTTYWRCMKHNGKENCKAILSFKLDFSSCSSNGHLHNHSAQYDMSQPLPNFQLEIDEPECVEDQIDLALLTRSNGSRNGTGTENKTATQKTKWNVMVHKGFEFGFPRIERKNTKWACYKKSLFNCPANVYTNWSGRVIKESDWAHNHKADDDYDKQVIIEGYMQDARTKEQLYYKLIPGKRGQRFVLYKGHRYSSDRLMSDGRIAWKCTKCKVFVIVAGRFATIEQRGGDHEHPVSDENELAFDTSYQQPMLDQEQSEDGQEQQQGGEFGVKNEQIEEDSLHQFEEEDEDLDDDDDLMIIPDVVVMDESSD